MTMGATIIIKHSRIIIIFQIDKVLVIQCCSVISSNFVTKSTNHVIILMFIVHYGIFFLDITNIFETGKNLFELFYISSLIYLSDIFICLICLSIFRPKEVMYALRSRITTWRCATSNFPLVGQAMSFLQ